MKRLIFFLSAIILLGLAGGAVYFGGLLFDASRKTGIDPYIFQPADLSRDRIGRPVALDVLSDEYILERLIKKFVREYMDVIPDADDVARRTAMNSALRAMTSAAVFDDWNMNVKPELSKLAESKNLRRARVTGGLRKAGEYYVVSYDLATYNPNDINAAPELQGNREMYLRLRFEKGLREEIGGRPFDTGKYLKSGGDPAAIFKFVVEEVK